MIVTLEERLAMLRNGQGASDQTAVKRMTLQALFRPPVDIMFNGDWEAVSSSLVFHILYKSNNEDDVSKVFTEMYTS